jgi:hypothetical protein
VPFRDHVPERQSGSGNYWGSCSTLTVISRKTLVLNPDTRRNRIIHAGQCISGCRTGGKQGARHGFRYLLVDKMKHGNIINMHMYFIMTPAIALM